MVKGFHDTRDAVSLSGGAAFCFPPINMDTLTDSERAEIATIIKERANEIATCADKLRRDDKAPSSAVAALSREISRLRSLAVRLTGPGEATPNEGRSESQKVYEITLMELSGAFCWRRSDGERVSPEFNSRQAAENYALSHALIPRDDNGEPKA